MSIVSSELVWRKSSVINDTGSNGGRMSATASTSGVKNNVFPDVPQSERTAGSTKYRKMFIHVANDGGLTLVAPRVFVETRTTGDDAVVLFAGTQTDTYSGVTVDGFGIATAQKYGMATLRNTVSPGASQVIAVVEDYSKLPIFANGMTIRISDKANINGGGNEEYHVINGSPGVNGNEITLTLTGTLANGYNSNAAKISSVYLPGDVTTSVSGLVDNSASGTLNLANIRGDNIGTIYAEWTVTFTGTVGQPSTNFKITGDATGATEWTGSTGSDCTPQNTNFSKNYFTILSTAWTGTFLGGETMKFTTSPASVPIWYLRMVPAGAASLSGNSVIVAIDGESS